jgi:hypothetical protein
MMLNATCPPGVKMKWPTGSFPNAKIGSPFSGVSTYFTRSHVPMSGFLLSISAAPPTCIPTKNSKAPPKKNRPRAEFNPVLSEADLSAWRPQLRWASSQLRWQGKIHPWSCSPSECPTSHFDGPSSILASTLLLSTFIEMWPAPRISAHRSAPGPGVGLRELDSKRHSVAPAGRDLRFFPAITSRHIQSEFPRPSHSQSKAAAMNSCSALGILNEAASARHELTAPLTT